MSDFTFLDKEQVFGEHQLSVLKKYGVKAMELAMEGKFNNLVTYKDGKLGYISLEEVVGNNKEIGAASGNTAQSNIRKITMDNELVITAKSIGINLGE